MPIYCNGVMCCYSNGRITDEWGKLFLLLSRLQKETKTPFTSANNALMWAPAPCSLHRPSSVQAANHHSGLWGHGQRYPFPGGQPTPAPRARLERWQGHKNLQASCLLQQKRGAEGCMGPLVRLWSKQQPGRGEEGHQ